MTQTNNGTRVYPADTFGAVDFLAMAHVQRAQAAADMVDGAGAALRRLARRIRDRLAASARRRATCRELLSLDDHMLADIGLNRYDVEVYAAGQYGTTEIVVAGDGPAVKAATVVDFARRTPQDRLGASLTLCDAHRADQAA